jgi:ubiquitin-activating enzyme E1
VFNDPLEAIVNDSKEFDPIMCGPIKVVPGKFTKWEKINVKGPLTLADLKKHFEETYKIEVSMITYGSATIYTSYDQNAKKRLPLRVPEAIELLTKKEIPKFRKFLAIGISGND